MLPRTVPVPGTRYQDPTRVSLLDLAASSLVEWALATPPPVVSERTAARHPGERLCARCLHWGTPDRYVGEQLVCTVCRPVSRLSERPKPLRQRGRQIPNAVVVEEVSWLAGWDTPAAIAKRLGFPSVPALERKLYRADRGDLIPRVRGYAGAADRVLA